MARTQDSDSEPSMEEILASIRRIITEDTPPLPTVEPAPFDEPVVAAGDVLELTEPLPVNAEPPAPASHPLVSEGAASASAQSLSALEALVVRDYAGSERTLEGLVRDMLKPMLRDWLDANLPEIVERLVSREVRRITARD